MSGSNSSNPDAGAPPEPVGLTVHSMPAPGAMLDRQRTASGRLKMLIVLLVCAAPVLASYLTYFVIRPQGSGAAYSTLIQPGIALPDISATDLDGKPVSLRSLKGRWLLVVVGGGACAQDCERRLYLQRQLREMMGGERERVGKLWLVLDDVPPKPALRAALAATPAMTVLRVPRPAVAGWLAPASGHALEDHLYIVDPKGDWMMRAPADADPARLKRDIERLLRASATWAVPGR